MRLTLPLVTFGTLTVLASLALAAAPDSSGTAKPPKGQEPAKPMEVTADQSLEWYQDQRIYLARGHAKAVRNDMVVEADLLTAHEREKAEGAPKVKPQPAANGAPVNDTGDIDRMTAEGHVRITTPTQRVQGEHAVYDLDKHTMVVTGNNLRYETEKEIVTARDSLEYYEDKKVAVARGHAIADEPTKHVEGDVLTAEFADGTGGNNQLTKMTALGHVTIITKTDIVHGDRGVYDKARDIAIVTGNVHITRADGTTLAGDVGEVDFTNNQSRLLNDGSGRVRALLASKTTDKNDKTAAAGTAAHAAPQASP
jgi:lipopolysaccharide export system protein LptA